MSPLTNLFLFIVSMSVNASFVVLGILLVRTLLNRFPKSFSYSLWAFALFRLLCPFTLGLTFVQNIGFLQNMWFLKPFSLTTVLNNHYSIPENTPSSYIPSISQIKEQPTFFSLIHNTVIPIEGGSHFNWLDFLALLWFMGFLCFLIHSVHSYLQLKHQITLATLVCNNIYETDQIRTPFVFGFIKPRIYLPTNIDKQKLSLILAHEQQHIKRRDYLIKPLSYLLLILHWFNPLMWISFVLMSKDMEMSCDEKVIRTFGQQAQKEYSYALLSFSHSSGILAHPIAFGENNIKPRIKNIMTYKKPALGTSLAALLILIATAVLLLSLPNTIGQFPKESAPKGLEASNTETSNTQTSNNVQNVNNTTDNSGSDSSITKSSISTSPSYSDAVASEIDAHLSTIISSPKVSSNPFDYIKGHRKEYEAILNYGNEAKAYLQEQLQSDNAGGLRGYIMNELLKELP